MSLLHVLFLIHANRSIETLQGTKGGILQDRVQGGAQTIANRMAGELGEQLRLESPVSAIAQDAEGVTVRAYNVTVRARRVIVALPLVLTGHLCYDPMLPVDRLMHHAHVVVTEGESYRLMEASSGKGVVPLIG